MNTQHFEDQSVEGKIPEKQPLMKRAHRMGKKIIRIASIMLIVVIVATISVTAVRYVVAAKEAEAAVKIEELEAKLAAALEEKEEIIVTNVIIEEKLEQIGELATSEFTYSGEKHVSDTRKWLGVNLPLTTNSVDMIYAGVIKVGYDIDEIVYSVNNDKKLICITIPTAKVLDNYIILDDSICTDKNNILHPIRADEVTRFFEEVEAEELERAEAEGIYTQAQNKLESIIENMFAGFSDYEVIFSA